MRRRARVSGRISGMALLQILLMFFPCPVSLAPDFTASAYAAIISAQEFARLREQMVKTQIEKRGVRDSRVLSAIRKVPRHLFVPETFRSVAYMDQPLPIGEEQTISQPYIVALMTELAEITEGEKVLEVGTGSGYQAAVLLEMTKRVYSIEINPKLAEFARKNLRKAGYSRVRTIVGDGYQGWPEAEPFDAILVTAAPDHIPQPLLDQLAEGGVLVIPVGRSRSVQTLTKIRKKEGEIITERSQLVSFVPLIRKRGRLQ